MNTAQRISVEYRDLTVEGDAYPGDDSGDGYFEIETIELGGVALPDWLHEHVVSKHGDDICTKALEQVAWGE